MLTANHGYHITQQLSRSQDEVGRWFESANKQLSVVSFDPYAYVSNFLLLKPTENTDVLYECASIGSIEIFSTNVLKYTSLFFLI